MKLRVPSAATMEIAVTAILGLFALAFLIESLRLPPTAALFPRLIGFPSLALVVILLAALVAAARRDRAATDLPTGQAAAKPAGPRMLWPASMGSMLGYFVLLEIIGFTLATFVYALAVPWMLGNRSRRQTIAFAVAVMAALVVLFGYVLRLSLPAGLIYNTIFG